MCNARDFEPEKKTLQTICTKMEKKNNLVNNLDNLFFKLYFHLNLFALKEENFEYKFPKVFI
tara:strand:- start:427 stop:612 length:186 start_codon:yes stop_codon:yes gene_type:complete